MYSNKWEFISDHADRLKVPGGWIVRSWGGYESGKALHQVFIKDVDHVWQLGTPHK